MKKNNCFFSFCVLFLFITGFTLQVQAQNKENSAKKNVEHNLPSYLDNSTTNGSINTKNGKISYKAVAGTMPILDAKKEQDTTARMSYVAYFKDAGSDPSRPITFFYNGGPGSSTLWLHMGSFGPKRVVTDGVNHMGGGPYKLVDNDYTLLQISDLVFIDMPATGFGRIAEGKESDYHSVDNDAEAFGNFIYNFITQYGRWNSPKFLYGESYGTLRSALLASVLQRRHSIDLNGIILLSQILDYGNSVDRAKSHPGLNNPYVLALPTYTATAWFHNKLPNKPANLETFLKEVEDFAITDYSLALAKGHYLDEASFNRMANKLHDYTGVSVDYIKKANLRMEGGEFRQQLMADEGKIPGRLGTDFSGPVMDPLAQSAWGDPQSDAISSAYVSLLNDYMRKELKFGDNTTYRVSAYGNMNWKSEHRGSPGTVNVINDLANALKKNPKLQVLLTGGYYDLATPYFEGKYELAQLPISKEMFENNIHFKFYESGHMIYLNEEVLEQTYKDVTDFINKNK